MRRPAIARLNRMLFGFSALPYDWLSQRGPWREHCREMLAGLSEDQRPRRLLDLGCGPGVSAIELLHAGAGSVVGVDLSAPMLARARRHRRRAALERRLDLVQADALALPFPDGRFDVITAHSLLYLLQDRERALSEMLRVLRPGGALVLLEPAEGRGGRAVLALVRGPSPTFAVTVGLWRIVSGALGRYTSESLAAALRAAGFVDVVVRPALEGFALQAQACRPRDQ